MGEGQSAFSVTNYNLNYACLLDFLSIVVTAVVAGAGAYFGSYLKKKGENLATHEEVDKLVKQVAVVTETTKQIEAKISNDVWERQRKWEMKRDALFEALKDIGSMETCLHSYIAIFEAARRAPSEHQLVWGDRKLEAIELHGKMQSESYSDVDTGLLVVKR